MTDSKETPVPADPACPVCKAPGVLYECVWCSANNYPAPAAQVAADTPCDMGDLCIGCSPRPDPKVCPEQVAATPKHNEGRDLLPCPFCGGEPHVEKINFGGKGTVGCKPCGFYLSGRLAKAKAAWNRRALATQPAARRVTDTERRLMKAASEAVELIRSIPERKLLALDSDPHPPSALSVAADEIAAALESFAQPAEGVSK